ncbi:DUF2827 domain-containing protein [Paraburkholderia kururiensis]|uniref:DUF2827 domain-containing protein n=1 Tax=Paraburkholderia kururiensis TaxID=984307 RepID=UPI0018F4C479|nr:DUF2827 domain-containing protein [Paraburkholderia kururiensis]
MGIKGARGLLIGITIGLHAPDESLWINGIKQNALYLAKLFQGSPLRHNVMLVNTTGVPVTPRLPWNLERFPVRAFDDVKDGLDVLIELGGQISADQTAHLKTRGTKLVSYCCGPEYVQMTEAMIFARRMCDAPFINQQYDEVWVIPQVMETSAHFFSVLRRRPVRQVPFVWDPMCLQERCRELPFAGEYRPRNAPARISIMEPNIDVLKFCLYPLLIAERAYRAAPALTGYVHVTNAAHLARGCPEFIGIARYLDLVRDSRVSFVDRHDTPQFLAEHTDIVVSHQWGLALNYFYFDVCWNGYALVHNAHLCRALGYCYEGNDVDEGARQLLLAMDEHPRQWEQYRSRQRQAIRPFLATHEPLIEAYDRLLFALLTGAHAA